MRDRTSAYRAWRAEIDADRERMRYVLTFVGAVGCALCVLAALI